MFLSAARNNVQRADSHSLIHQIRGVVLLLNGKECRLGNGKSVGIHYRVAVITYLYILVITVLFAIRSECSGEEYLGNNEAVLSVISAESHGCAAYGGIR